jgi:hypothetical protein
MPDITYDFNSNLYQVMLSFGYNINVNQDVLISVFDFRPGLQKYVQYVIGDGRVACKLSEFLSMTLSDFMHQRGFGLGKTEQIVADLAGKLSSPIENHEDVTTSNETPMTLNELPNTFSAEEILVSDYPVQLLETINKQLPQLLTTDIDNRAKTALHSITETQIQFSSLSNLLSSQLIELSSLLTTAKVDKNVNLICNNIFFRLIMYRCAKRGSFSPDVILSVTKRIENYTLIHRCIKHLRGREIEIDLFELNKRNFIIVGDSHIMSRYELIKHAITRFEHERFTQSIVSLKLSHLSDLSKQRLEWGWRLAKGQTLEEIGCSASISRERVRQVLNQFFEASYRDLSTLVLEAERLQEQKKLSIVKDIFVTETVVTVQVLEARLGLKESEVYKIVPKLLHRFIDDFAAPESTKELQKLRLAAALQEAAIYEHCLTANNYNELVRKGFISAPGSQTIIKTFGTWNQACESAGVNHSGRSSGMQKQYNRQEVVEMYCDYMLDQTSTGSTSKYEDWSKGKGVISSATIRKWFPYSSELYSTCRKHIRISRPQAYARYIATVFEDNSN